MTEELEPQVDPDVAARLDADHIDQPYVEELERLLAVSPRSTGRSDPRFLDWFAEEIRSGDRRTRRLTDAQVAARGAELLARVQARMHRVRRWYRPTPARASEKHAVGVVELGIAAGVGRELWDEAPESWIELPPELPDGNYLALKVVGDSMAPLMHTGDTVLVERGPKVQENTVIVARHPDDGYVCKRVREIRSETIELESLAPGGPAVSIPRRAELILGTVLVVWCEHRAR